MNLNHKMQKNLKVNFTFDFRLNLHDTNILSIFNLSDNKSTGLTLLEFDQIIRNDNLNIDEFKYIIKNLVDRGYTELASKYCHSNIKKFSKHSDLFAIMGYICFLQKKHKSVFQYINKARTLGRLLECDQQLITFSALNIDNRPMLDVSSKDLIGLWPTNQSNLNIRFACLKRLERRNAELTTLIEAAAAALKFRHIETAIKYAKSALALNESFGEAWFLLAAAYRVQKNYEGAEQSIRKAIQCGSKSWRTRNLHGLILLETCRPEAALVEFNKAAKIADEPSVACGNAVLAQHYIPSANDKVISQEISRYANAVETGLKPFKTTTFRKPSLPIRVGLLSGNFVRHPTLFLSLKALEKLDSAAIELIAYNTEPAGDVFTQRLKAKCQIWREIGHLSDDQAFEVMREDRLDLLIDMAGPTKGRPALVARKPAPVQSKWIGGLYSSSGLAAMDWLLADDTEIPSELDHNYVEQIYRIDNGYIIYEPPEYAPEVSNPPFKKNGFVTFSCFNNPSKINERLVSSWGNILNRVENSQIILKGGGFSSIKARKLVLSWFSKDQIEESRIQFESHAPHRELLEAYNRTDIALDTWPYSGGLTTCEALWMGNPVITLPGQTFASRHSASHLTNIGLSEWITSSWSEYENAIVKLAHDKVKLSQTRAKLRTIVQNSSLCDADTFASKLTNAMIFMANNPKV